MSLLRAYVTDPLMWAVVLLMIERYHNRVEREACCVLLKQVIAQMPIVPVLVEHAARNEAWIYFKSFEGVTDLMNSGMYSFLSALYNNQRYAAADVTVNVNASV